MLFTLKPTLDALSLQKYAQNCINIHIPRGGGIWCKKILVEFLKMMWKNLAEKIWQTVLDNFFCIIKPIILGRNAKKVVQK